MPEAQPAAEVSPAVANGANRSAIEAKSAQALRDAIEKVSAEPPAAKPEAQAKPDDAEPVETPADASGVTNEAETVKVETASTKLEKSARRTIRARRDAKAAEDARASEARAFQERDAARQEAAAAREFLDLLKSDPMAAMAKAGHDPAQLVPNWLKKVAEPEKTPEQKASEAAQKKIEELEAWQKQQELRERNQSMTAQVAAYQSTCAEAISDKDAFEFVHRDGGTEALYRYITDTYELAVTEAKAGRLTTAEAKTGRYSPQQLQQLADQRLRAIANTPPALFAKQMESELRKKFATPKGAAAAAVVTEAGKKSDGSLLDAARNTHSSKTLKQRQKAKAATVDDDDEPRGVRGGSGARTVPLKKAFSKEALIADAIRAMNEGAGRRH